MSFVIDFVNLRRPKLGYVSPPICEFVFSGSGVLIVLEPLNPLLGPTGLEIGGRGHLTLSWNNYPGALCYTIYKAVDSSNPFGDYVIVAECINDPHIVINPGCYRVSAITLEGESALSDPICNTTVIPPEVQTDAATGVTGTAATLNGEVFGNGAPTTVFFQYGTSLAYGTNTAGQPIGSGPAIVNFNQPIIGLTTGTLYHFRAVASNVNGTAFGLDKTFIASAGDTPTVTVLATIPDAHESGPVPGEFTIFRGGDTSNANTVHFTLTGTAIPGFDYVDPGTTKFFPAGATQEVIQILPIDLGLTSGTRSVILTLVTQFGESYVVGTPSVATVTINEDDVADAPCTIFENDNTSQGQRTMPNGPLATGANFAPAWATLTPGNYQLQFVSGAYRTQTGPDLFIVNAGAGGVTIELSVHHGATCTTIGADNTIAANTGLFATENAAAADFQTQYTGNEKTFFVGDGSDDNVCMVEDSSMGLLGVSGTTKPIFELVKIKKLIAPEPLTLQIANFAAYADGRYVIRYAGEDTAPIAFAASALDVQNALNAHPGIIADGGVTVAVNPAIPSFGSGFDITWNINGARALIDPQITTISPGIFGQISETQTGNVFQPEIQTLFVGKRCQFFDDDLVNPAWDGSNTVRHLSSPVWRQSVSSGAPLDLPGAPLSIAVQNMAMIECFVYLASSGLPGSMSGCGWVMIIIGWIGFINTPSLLWSGLKFTGNDPTGVYNQVDSSQLDQPWTDACPVDISHGVQQLTLTGTF